MGDPAAVDATSADSDEQNAERAGRLVAADESAHPVAEAEEQLLPMSS